MNTAEKSMLEGGDVTEDEKLAIQLWYTWKKGTRGAV